MAPHTDRFGIHNTLRFAQYGPVRRTNGLSIIETFKLVMSEKFSDIIESIIYEKMTILQIWYIIPKGL